MYPHYGEALTTELDGRSPACPPARLPRGRPRAGGSGESQTPVFRAHGLHRVTGAGDAESVPDLVVLTAEVDAAVVQMEDPTRRPGPAPEDRPSPGIDLLLVKGAKFLCQERLRSPVEHG